MLWGWLAGGLLYTYLVVTVERVDYYLYPLLPLGALVGREPRRARARAVRHRSRARAGALAALAALWLLRCSTSTAGEIAPYYAWSKNVYTRALALDAASRPAR